MESAGFAGYFPKPVQASMLKKAVALILNPSKTTPSIITRFDLAEIRHTASLQTLTASVNADLRVLVAEDNLVNQKLAATLLGKAGCRVDLALNGMEAVAKWKTGCYDAVFMDCQMPEMDGYTATGTIRQLEGEETRTFIVAMTANALEGDRERCLAAGMDQYLTKPLRIDSLQAILSTCKQDRSIRTTLSPI